MPEGVTNAIPKALYLLDSEAFQKSFAVTAGAPQVRVGAGAPDGRLYEELFAAARESLAGVEDLARSNGVKALIERSTTGPSARAPR